MLSNVGLQIVSPEPSNSPHLPLSVTPSNRFSFRYLTPMHQSGKVILLPSFSTKTLPDRSIKLSPILSTSTLTQSFFTSIILLYLGFISKPVEAINKPCLPPKKEVISNS